MRIASDSHVGQRTGSVAAAAAMQTAERIIRPLAKAPASNASFERAVIPLLPGLRLHALRLTRSASDADDLLQEALLRAFRFWPRYQERDQCRAWLQRILNNVFRSEYRRQLRRKTQLAELEAELRDAVCPVQPAASELEDSAALPSTLLHLRPQSRCDAAAPTIAPGVRPDAPAPQGAELDERLSLGLSSLSTEHRNVIWLVDVKERSYREAARELECPIGTVMSRLHRARVALRSALLAQA